MPASRRADTWVGFHTFRHTTATRLFVGQGWNAVQVAKFLGHADAGFTLRTYVHLLPEDLPKPDFGQGVGNRRATQASENGRNAATPLDTESADLQAEASVALGASGAP
jgi:Phage integrase family